MYISLQLAIIVLNSKVNSVMEMYLTLILVSFLGVCFDVGEGLKISPSKTH